MFKRYNSALIACVMAIMSTLVLAGYSLAGEITDSGLSMAGTSVEQEQILQQEGSVVQSDVSPTMVYTGKQSVEEVLADVSLLEDNLGIDLPEFEIVRSFLEFQEEQPHTLGGCAGVGAYTSHYENRDRDLYLEYSWYGSQRYYISACSYAVYWALRGCYNWRITHWSWSEGSKRRATLVLGSCVNVPFWSPGNWYLEYYLRVVPN